jgi:small-conductance mechanosensitive channel
MFGEGRAMPSTRLRRYLRVAAAVMLAWLACAELPAAPAEPVPEASGEAVESQPVRFRGVALFDVSRGIGALGVTERAAAIERRLQQVAEDESLALDSLRPVERSGSTDLMLGDELLLTVSEAEARAQGRTRAQLVADRGLLIRTAIGRDRAERGSRQLLISAALSLAALVAFALFCVALVWSAQRLNARLDPVTRRFVTALGPRLSRLLTPSAAADAAARIVNLVAVLLGIVALYLCLEFVLSRFPWTRGLAEQLVGIGTEGLAWLGGGLVGYLPNALNLLLIFLVVRYLIRIARWVFLQLERGSVTLSGFYPEWAQPTYQIVRFFMLAFAAVAAFPYLPGSGSEGFRGISLLLGVTVSLGAASAVANIIAGLVLTYMRPFRIGERVRIADTVGDVTGKDLFVVRIRTIKNVDVTIPNSLVLANHIVNYSSSAESHGLVLHTTVTIGYDVPWRRVHELLVEAARRTEGIVDEPAPFVLQTGLDDFYPRYELNAYTRDPGKMSATYSDLHANIQDAFNEAGVEILSPHYVAARDGNRTAIPDDYLPKNYQPAGFTLNWPRRSPAPEAVPQPQAQG